MVMAQLVEPLICQLPMLMGEPVLLYNSINSSLLPLEPRVRNSLITTEFDAGCVAVGVGVNVLVLVRVLVCVLVLVRVLVGRGGVLVKVEVIVGVVVARWLVRGKQ